MVEHLNVVYFAHGRDSGPWGRKIKRLARIAKVYGFHVESVDYQGMLDPDQRVAKLLELQPTAIDNLVLVGSSLGGYVAASASEKLKPKGLFLMAPAVNMPGFGRKTPQPRAEVMTAVHGWHDDVVPADGVIAFCRQYGIGLHLLDCGHTLKRRLADVEALFEVFLSQVVNS